MKKITYQPARDELVMRIQTKSAPHCVDIGHFNFCWGNDGKVQSLSIESFMEELRAFKKNLHTVRLGGIWKGLRITDSEIEESRKEILDWLDKRW